ncbi:MAG TPA: PaaI family thioesterase [Thermoanaerobaculia bacterium]|nr:PaaI family thioesterase [Thermoanaerobaculia bacterium]
MSDPGRREGWRPDHRHIPHSRAIGMRMIEAGGGTALMSVPYDPKLVGNPATGVLHGGVITSVLDSASGAAVASALGAGQWRPIATLDLRIDYMRPATPGRDVIARAECYRVTRNVAFVRGVAYHDDPADPIATTVATFMLSTPDREPVKR